MARIKIGTRSFPVPGSKPLRIVLGIALVLGGMLGFLPVLGFWMIPLGLVVLSIDSFRVRRLRRRFEVWLGRRRAARAKAASVNREATVPDNSRVPDSSRS